MWWIKIPLGDTNAAHIFVVVIMSLSDIWQKREGLIPVPDI